MDFYILSGRESYAGYCGKSEDDQQRILLQEPPDPRQWTIPTLTEYLGNPPARPKRRGEYHSAGWAHFFSDRGIDLLGEYLEASGVCLPVRIEGRGEQFCRYWITRVVDCLDMKRSDVRSVADIPGSIGMIRTPVIDVGRWDGSDIFRVPGDPNVKFLATQRFVDACRIAKLKGAEFSRSMMDPNPIRI